MSIDKGLGRWFMKDTHRQSFPNLGSREVEVLKILWREGELTAHDALGFIANEQITLSTMQSTMERLYRKKLVSRTKSGRSYLYQSAISQSNVINNLLHDLTAQICDGDLAPIISGFMSFVDENPSASNSIEIDCLQKRSPKDSDD
jgi:predicted transcriptional regulator